MNVNKSNLFESCADKVIVDDSISEDDFVFIEEFQCFKNFDNNFNFDSDSDLFFYGLGYVLKSNEKYLDDDYLVFMHAENVCEKQVFNKSTLNANFIPFEKYVPFKSISNLKSEKHVFQREGNFKFFE